MFNDYTGQFMPIYLFTKRYIYIEEQVLQKEQETKKQSSKPFGTRLHVLIPLFFIQFMLILFSLNNTAPTSLQDITLRVASIYKSA